jgi:dTMP kinase
MARNMGMDFVAGLNMAATGGLKPDVTFFFDISVEEALARRGKRGEASDRIELAGIKFQEDVRKGYLELAKESDGRIVTVDASRGVEEIFEDIKETLKGKI